MLELKDVSVIFNQGTSLEKRALDEVSVHIPEGQFVTVLGSNGAGKSTFFNVITGAAEEPLSWTDRTSRRRRNMCAAAASAGCSRTPNMAPHRI